ncbi:protein hupE [Pseudomonas aeruginosa]|uniref:HupE/UreJ family protein n=1 Tax=Pseudomonas aeruginosa TaxID=287 RepID=UPI0006248C4D|nr:HupE/UreJ family protein [Pseudomonas aeruginosa]AKG02066.1 protein hupE [Pseudomonas aeruginosa]
MKLPKLLAALALLAAPALAFAHPGHGEHGLVAGLAHPLTGLDHLLAMFAVGLWAAQQQGAARLALPCTFVGTMLVGGLLGFEGLQLPFMETGIAASVLALGLCVALAVRPPLALELPDLSSPWLYALGFVAATAALHAAGYALVRFLPQAAAPLVRLAGLASAGAGVWLLAG